MANKTIHELTDLGSSLASGYELAIYNTTQNANTTGKGSILNLLGTSITGLNTTASTLPGAINELDGDIGDINTLIGDTSISSIGDGTLTGAISTLNTNFITYRNRTYNNERYFKMEMLNYGNSITLQGFHTGNNCGFCIVGAGSNASFYVFTYRPTESKISIQKIGGNNSITITGTCSTTGTIILTMSDSDQITVFYQGT